MLRRSHPGRSPCDRTRGKCDSRACRYPLLVNRGRLWGTTMALLSVACSGEAPPPPAERAPTADGRWERLAPVPTPRTEVTAVAVEDRIYVIGGVGAPRGKGTT